MNREQIRNKLEGILLNQNIDNPYINIGIAVDWIVENFTTKEKPKVGWLEDWCNLFPKEVRSNGLPIYSKPKDCLNKMQKFVKDNPEYDKTHIFAATKSYLRDRYKNNWEYTRSASNFISHRDKGSLLASWCEAIKSEKKEVIHEHKFFL